MFFVINKQKIYTYLVSIITVVLLFCIAGNMESEENTLETSATTRLLPIYNVQTEKQEVALTINCAWNDSDVDKILNVLSENNVKATFFMVGDWVDKYPEAVKKISDASHEIGSHSNTHPHVNQLSYEKNVEEIKESCEKIQNITGKKINLYRTPYGEYNNTVIRAANENGYMAIHWSLDTLDYNGLTGNEMWNRIKDKMTAGDIILMHNGTEHTAESLDMIIKNIKEKGLNLVTVSDLIYKENYSIDINGKQIQN